jgi:hypothetical protein
MFVTSLLRVIPALFLLLSCMLVTSLLHVILVVFNHYFSHIYQSSLFLCSWIPFPLAFISVQSLLARLSFICTPLVESIPQTYIHPPPVYSLLLLCFACSGLFYLFCGLDRPMECVSMLIFLWWTMHASHYLPLLFLHHNTQSPFPCFL